MDKTRQGKFLFRCPMCGAKLWRPTIEGHRRMSHRELSSDQYEKILMDAIRSGKILPPYWGNRKSPISGTQKMSKSKPKNKYGIGKLFQGGRVSPR